MNTDLNKPLTLISTVHIPTADAELEGDLHIPEGATGLVLFVHGSGSSRFSPRNQYVADLLNQAGLATLLFDLLTEQENQVDLQTREYRFDIDLLSRRTIAAIDWITQQPETKFLPIGLFGASTGAAAALIAAQARPKAVKCVVSRGGRPDLSMPALIEVAAPTLLIVGGLDHDVLKLNQMAQKAMQAPCELTVINGATHLFEEPGTLDLAANIAKKWFLQKL
ncbi:MAG: alpha/beta family hydrolase [Pseudomonadota bacterium]|nr:alpha/beta family hydrolase [Pseudomonadota bacterium]